MTNDTSLWVSDEEIEEIDDLGDVFEETEQLPKDQSEDVAAASTPLPYLDPEVAEELLGEGPPTWFGVRWRDIPEADQADAWNALREWVDWLVREYKLPTSVVPPCWYKHSDITAELYAAMCMEHKVWEEQEPGLSPMMFWHPNLQQMIHRLREAVTTAGCVSAGQHKEPMAVGSRAFELDYDEADWQQHVNTATTTQQFERPERGVLYIRAGIVDPEGTMVTHSAPVGIKHAAPSDQPAVGIEYLSTNSKYNVLQAAWQHYSNDYELIWESSLDGETWEIYEGNHDHTNDPGRE